MRAYFVLKEAGAGLLRSWRGALVALLALVAAALALGLAVAVVQAGAATADELHATGTVKLLCAAGAGLLVLGAALFVANAVRQSILDRRREVEVMRLVGATNWFIRWPFLIEAALIALVGGAVAVALLALARETLIEPLAGHLPLVAAPGTIDFALLALLLPLACVAVTAAGAGLTLRRLLRV